MFVKKTGTIIAITSAFILAGYTETFAQVGTSGITGTIYDETQAVVGGASIYIISKTTNQTRQTISAEDGFFSIQNLQPGDFLIEIEAEGFNKLKLENISISIGETVFLKGTLKAAKTEAVIEVISGETSKINTFNQQIAGVISETAVENLPLNGRNFLDLALLLPGNTPAPIFSPIKAFLSQVSSGGQSARGNGVFVDGADNNEDIVGGILQNFPIDSVREFQVQLAQYSAESGRSNSSIINIVTKKGSNEFHGSGAFFFRNDRLSGLPPTLDRSSIASLGNPPFDRQQYAFTFGGPIKNDRIHFFNALEYRNQDGIVIVGQRDIVNRVVTTAFAPTSLRDFLLTSRVDLDLKNGDHMFFRYGIQREDNVGSGSPIRPIPTADYRLKVFNRSQSFVYNWVHTFSPRLLNDFTANESYFTDEIPDSSEKPFTLRFPSIVDGGTTLDAPLSDRQNRVQIRDVLSLVAGSHTIKIGGELHFVNTKVFDGSFSGGLVGLAEDFASRDRNRDGRIDDMDILIAFTSRVPNPLSSRSVNSNNNKYLAFFFQDNWKVKPNLTLNLGLRYELDTNVTGRNNFIMVPSFATKRPKIDGNNFAPRIGFNWSPFKDNKTSIRGGYGVFYSRTLLALAASSIVSTSGLIFEARAGSELDSNGNLVPGSPTLSSNTFSGPILEESPGSDIVVFDPNLATPYVQQFSFGIERELPYNIVISADGLHAYGLKFIQSQAINEEPLIFSNVSALKNWYDSLLVKVERRRGKFFNFLASYTFAKSLTMSQDFQLGGTQSRDVKVDKGPPPNDIRHRFSFAGVYNAPFGINISSIFTLESDVPINIRLDDGTRLPIAQINAGARQFKTGAELNAFIRQLNIGGGANGLPIPFVADNLKLGDGLASVDLRINKEFKLKDNISIQSIAEVFNVFNVTNIRGSSINNFSGIQNVLVPDSSVETDPGFLRASTFGRRIENAGGVFGTGGPRAFQFAVRLSF
ncbi:MAG: TonB-dependent receptor [Acidobacteria bacterium]|nr:TonB-dependent receptor [Acidobacteriota bacterium]